MMDAPILLAPGKELSPEVAGGHDLLVFGRAYFREEVEGVEAAWHVARYIFGHWSVASSHDAIVDIAAYLPLPPKPVHPYSLACDITDDDDDDPGGDEQKWRPFR